MQARRIIIGVIGAAVVLMIAWAILGGYTEKKEAVPNPSVQNSQMTITSPSFKNNETIPSNYTCSGVNINPELRIADVPAEAKSFALIVDDPDAPGGTWTHWMLWNIDPATTVIPEGGKPAQAVEGKTSFGRSGYGGPCPPAGKPHHYHFKLHALDTVLNLPAGADVRALEAALEGHVIASAELVGLYGR
jgi:hypothetical protein